MFCPNCGSQNSQTARTCVNCGHDLKGAAWPTFKERMILSNHSPSTPRRTDTSPRLIDTARQGVQKQATARQTNEPSGDVAPSAKPKIDGTSMLSFQRDTLVHNYRLLDVVGKGGMGCVWKALDIALRREVAIKFMDPKYVSSAALRERFEQEAKLLGELGGVHFPHVYAIGDFHGTPYFVTELLDGYDLNKYRKLHSRDLFGVCQAAWIVSGVCEALRIAHRKGIVHRDLKLGNIFMCNTAAGLAVKVLDLGIAKSLLGSRKYRTGPGEFLGTLTYMAPEQARSAKDADHRSDIYSLTAIFFLLVTERPPIAAADGKQLLDKLLSGRYKVPPPSELVAGLPRLVDEICVRGLARAPEKRYKSVDELFDALRLLGPEAVKCTRNCATASLPSIPTHERSSPVANAEPLGRANAPTRMEPEQPHSTDDSGPREIAADASSSIAPLSERDEWITCPDPDPDSMVSFDPDPLGILPTLRPPPQQAAHPTQCWYIIVERTAHGPFTTRDLVHHVAAYPGGILWNAIANVGMDIEAAEPEGLLASTSLSADIRCPTCTHTRRRLSFCPACGHVGCDSKDTVSGKLGCATMGMAMSPGHKCPNCQEAILKEKRR